MPNTLTLVTTPHLPDVLIRSIISAIGTNAKDQGDYWRSGTRIFETELQSWGLIESIIDSAGTGRIILRTKQGKADDFLANLSNIVEREEARFGLKPTQVDSSLPTERLDSAEKTDKPPPKYGQPRRPDKDKSRFFSYAQQAEKEYGFPVKMFCTAFKAATDITIRTDVNELAYGDAIRDFMNQLANGEYIYLWITDAYLKSPYCMFELNEIWKRATAENSADESYGSRFDGRVKVIITEVSLGQETEIRRYISYWQEQLNAITEDMNSMEVIDAITLRDRNSISQFCGNVGKILRYTRSRIRHDNFEEMLNEAIAHHGVENAK